MDDDVTTAALCYVIRNPIYFDKVPMFLPRQFPYPSLYEVDPIVRDGWVTDDNLVPSIGIVFSEGKRYPAIPVVADGQGASSVWSARSALERMKWFRYSHAFCQVAAEKDKDDGDRRQRCVFCSTEPSKVNKTKEVCYGCSAIFGVPVRICTSCQTAKVDHWMKIHHTLKTKESAYKLGVRIRDWINKHRFDEAGLPPLSFEYAYEVPNGYKL